MENLSIDFYSDNEAAVSINWESDTLQSKDPDARRFAESLSFFNILRAVPHIWG